MPLRTIVRPTALRVCSYALVWALAIAGGFVATPTRGEGQEAPLPGDRIRFTSAGVGEDIEGRLVFMGPEVMAYEEESSGQEVRLDMASVESLDVLRRERHTFVGLGLGALGGGVVAGVLAYATSDPDDWIIDRGDATLIGAVGGALLGSAIGAVVGHSKTTESWKPVAIPRVTVDSQGVGLAVRLRF